MKTKMKSLANNRVYIEYIDLLTEQVVKLELFAPPEGGYVKINDKDSYPQICKKLKPTGNTLEWYPSKPLKNLIYNEYRNLIREQKKELESI